MSGVTNYILNTTKHQFAYRSLFTPAAALQGLFALRSKMNYGYLLMLLVVGLYTVAVYYLSLSKTGTEFDLQPFLRTPGCERDNFFDFSSIISLIFL